MMWPHALRITACACLEVLSIRLESDTRVDTFAPLFAASVQLGASYVLVTSQDANRGRAIDNLGRLGELAARYRFGRVSSSGASPKSARCKKPASSSRTLASRTLALWSTRSTYIARGATRPLWLRYHRSCTRRCNCAMRGGRRRPTPTSMLRRSRIGSVPGDGELWLADFLHALPASVPISLEAPCARDAQSTLAERAVRAARAMHAFRAHLDGPTTSPETRLRGWGP